MTYETSETSTVDSAATVAPGHRLRRNKVPEVTVYFWLIKVLCTTVGETAADLLNEKLGLGLTGVSLLMSVLLAAVLVVQFRTTAYRPGVYWLAVALISIVGTLISDNLTDNLGVPLTTSTTVFAIVLTLVFAVWYRRERTLSMHSIDTPSRESFYWLAVLFTFALGTAAGDLVAERMDLGYWVSAVLFAQAIAAVADDRPRPAAGRRSPRAPGGRPRATRRIALLLAACAVLSATAATADVLTVHHEVEVAQGEESG